MLVKVKDKKGNRKEGWEICALICTGIVCPSQGDVYKPNPWVKELACHVFLSSLQEHPPESNWWHRNGHA